VPAASKVLTDLNVRLYKSSIDVPGPETARLAEAARTAGCYVEIGVCERSQTKSGSMFNTHCSSATGGQAPEAHPYRIRTDGSLGWLGDTPTAVDTPFGPLTALACSENSNPLAGFDIVSRGPRVHAMSWPPHFIMAGHGAPDLPDISLLTARHFALVSKAFVISAPGAIDRSFYQEVAAWTNDPQADLTAGINDGGTAIVSPGSEVLAARSPAAKRASSTPILTLTSGSDRRCSRTLPVTTTARDVFTLEVNRAPSRYEDPMATR
jgi:nitrilase